MTKVIRHNVRITESGHPALFAELHRTPSSSASIQRLLNLASLGLMAERVQFHTPLVNEPRTATVTAVPAPPAPGPVAHDDLSSADDDLLEVFNGARSASA